MKICFRTSPWQRLQCIHTAWTQQILEKIKRYAAPCLAIGLVACLAWAPAAPAHAVNNPELLPEEPTVVIDLARILNDAQEEYLNTKLPEFEEETGWKLRVLTQFDQTPGRAVKDFWGLNDKSIMMVADPRGGNLLNFSVGAQLYPLLPSTFWIELQTRFGNQFYVRDNGEDGAVRGAINALETCLERGGCAGVPGLPREQWILTLVTSILGGVICGFAAQPRNVYTANPGRTSSIAVPILAKGTIQATVALVFFASALKVEEAVERFLPQLQATADAIGAELSV